MTIRVRVSPDAPLHGAADERSVYMVVERNVIFLLVECDQDERVVIEGRLLQARLEEALEPLGGCVSIRVMT
ncbi:hypothetical protein BC938DRAFT_476958, partial [Jimgerdemannia flammicorona]